MRGFLALLLMIACGCTGSSSGQDSAAAGDQRPTEEASTADHRAADEGLRDFRSDNEVADLGPDARSDGPTLLPDGPMPSTEVYVAPAQAAINGVGATTTVEIRVANVTKLYSFAIERSFDAAVVQIEDTDPRPSAPGVQVTPGDFFDLNQQVLVNKVDNAAGTVELAVTEAYPSTAQSGDGVLFSAIFKGSKAGSCPLHIGVARLPDDSHPDPLDIPAITKDGQLTVTP